MLVARELSESQSCWIHAIVRPGMMAWSSIAILGRLTHVIALELLRVLRRSRAASADIIAKCTILRSRSGRLCARVLGRCQALCSTHKHNGQSRLPSPPCRALFRASRKRRRHSQNSDNATPPTGCQGHTRRHAPHTDVRPRTANTRMQVWRVDAKQARSTSCSHIRSTQRSTRTKIAYARSSQRPRRSG